METLVKSKYGLQLNHIGGEKKETKASTLIVESPLTGEEIAEIHMSTYKELDDAVKCASEAYKTWSKTPIKDRVQIFFKYKTMVEENITELALLVQEENGKTFSEAKAEVEKSIELTEFACSLPQLVGGELLEVSKGVECKTIRESLGVVACIAPFNFPHMVPHWTVPNAIALGNTVILKPSELVPLSAIKMAEMLEAAGLPKGVFNIVNGGKEIVESICDHPGIEAVSFVGSTPVAKLVYARSSMNLKRSIALGGAKNHLIVLPDASPEMTANNVVASMSGCAGQRCMAASVMVAVGDVDHIIEKMKGEAAKIVCGENLGSVISKAAKDRITKYIDEAEANGATILFDGRGAEVKGKEGGYYLNPTIIDHVGPTDKLVTEEVFGPVIAIVRVDTYEEAMDLENNSLFGNAAAVFTQSGKHANYLIERASAGMIGVNIGVPVPREPFSFAGWNDSKFGVGDVTGKSSIEFWTQLKKVTTKWTAGAQANWMS